MGGIEITDCIAGDVTYVNGHVHDSGIFGDLAFSRKMRMLFSIDCSAVELHDLPIIDCGGTGQDLIMTGWDGDLNDLKT